MDWPCPNHGFPVHHKLWECELHKHFIGNPSQKKAKTEEDTQMAEMKDDATEAFPELTGCLMIFGGP